MCNLSVPARFILSIAIVIVPGSLALGQHPANSGFGPVVRAYLGYLNNEQEVVDDRASRREITAAYYRRNVNRIHALRDMAIRLVRQSGNDYVPELEAVTADEFGTIFEHPPHAAELRPSEIFANKFRFLGSVHTGETFYLFARLDPYEQAELMQRSAKSGTAIGGSGGGPNLSATTTRARRVVPK
ncbi:MAG: hypothetical protein ABR607_12480 [Pyrinomonadaceae bacterium]